MLLGWHRLYQHDHFLRFLDLSLLFRWSSVNFHFVVFSPGRQVSSIAHSSWQFRCMRWRFSFSRLLASNWLSEKLKSSSASVYSVYMYKHDAVAHGMLARGSIGPIQPMLCICETDFRCRWIGRHAWKSNTGSCGISKKSWSNKNYVFVERDDVSERKGLAEAINHTGKMNPVKEIF